MGNIEFEDLDKKKHQIYDESRAKEKALIEQQKKAIQEFLGDEPKNVKIITHGGSVYYYYQLIAHHTVSSKFTEFTTKVSFQKKISFGSRTNYSSVIIETNKDYHLDILAVKSIEVIDDATITTKVVMAEKLIQLLEQ